MVGGVVVTDLPFATSALRTRIRNRNNLVTKVQLEKSLESLVRFQDQARAEYDTYQISRRKQFEESPSFQRELLNEIREDLERSLAQAHDYIGLLRQIRQHIQAIFETHFPGMPPHEAAERLPNEGAIYFASELMFEKLDSTRYLRNPALVFGDAESFALHQFLSKYVKIYRGYAKQRNISLVVTGESLGTVVYFSPPIGAAFQAVLDNALKYAPASTNVDVIFKETSQFISVSVSSLGPKIDMDERELIFRVGYRAAGAERIDQSGMGMGLATAKLVSDELGLDLQVDQQPIQSNSHPSYFLTKFSMQLERD